VSECDREASITRKPWPTRGCCDMDKNHKNIKVMGSNISFLISVLVDLGYQQINFL